MEELERPGERVGGGGGGKEREGMGRWEEKRLEFSIPFEKTLKMRIG